MPLAASSLSLAAATIYALPVIAAGLAARSTRPQKAFAWHGRIWHFLAILFVVLIALRILNAEEMLRDQLRGMLASEGQYGNRRDLQRPIAAGAIVISAPAAFWLIYRIAGASKDRLNLAVLAAFASGLGMIFLVGLRIVSLHPIDALLYGPRKLNWLFDVGLSLLVTGFALYYLWIVRFTGRRA
jgi:hypothetical protein